MPNTIHIFGAPGAGSSTLGRALAARLGLPCFDTDDYYWFTDDPLPYRRKRNPEHRRQLLLRDFGEHGRGVVAGALCGWGDALVPRFEAVLYLWAPAEVRLPRIEAREAARYGAGRIGAGGDLHAVFVKFCRWAADYDNDGTPSRNRAKDLEWLKKAPCPVFQLDAALPAEELLEKAARLLP